VDASVQDADRPLVLTYWMFVTSTGTSTSNLF